MSDLVVARNCCMGRMLHRTDIPCCHQSEAPSREPSNKAQRVGPTRDKEPCEHQPVTDNNLQEPLLLYDQIVAREVSVAATVCSEHTFPAAIQAEAPSGELNNTADHKFNVCTCGIG